MAEPRDLAEYQTDHDLIVGMVRDLSHFGEDIRELKDGVTKKNDDHELRIRANERAITDMVSSAKTWRLIMGGAISLCGLGIGIIGLIR
jgi:hypothetical protein